MIIEEALYYHLVNDEGVYGLAGTRGYPLSIPQDIALPAWAYQRVSGERETAHDGALGMASGRWQITCQAESYDGAKSLAEAIRLCLDGFAGWMGQAPGLRVFGGKIESEIDGYGMTSGIYTVRLDVSMFYKEI